MYGHYKLTIEVEKTFFYTEIKIKTLAKGLRREDDGTFTVICEKMGETFEINAKIRKFSPNRKEKYTIWLRVPKKSCNFAAEIKNITCYVW